ncbi:MAG TPA: DEAD/DEAH box helicase, partial [Trebonia sp.]
MRALAAHDIREPFAIQARALPDALAGRDVLGRAQTGSGKTLAFGLPLLTRLARDTGPRRDKAPRGLVLVPTRELAQQVADVLMPLGRCIGVTIATVYGGVSIGRQITRVRHADIVVATPGRLIDLLERHACTLSGIQVTVLDEADHMADLGFLPAVTRILDQTPADGQRMFFSATLDRGV